MDLAGALDLGRRELVAAVGAGGKKTALGRLIEDADARGRSVCYTTTTHTPPLAELPTVIAAPTALPLTADRSRSPVTLAAERVADPARAEVKVRGYPPEDVDSLFEAAAFEWLLVKADGARRREFKAPDPAEPQLPRRASVVLVIASVAAIGRPLTDATVHRPERVARLSDTPVGAEITPATMAAVLASPAGGLKRVPTDATAVLLCNKADTDDLRTIALEVVERARDRTDRFDRCLVTSFRNDHLEIVA